MVATLNIGKVIAIHLFNYLLLALIFFFGLSGHLYVFKSLCLILYGYYGIRVIYYIYFAVVLYVALGLHI